MSVLPYPVRYFSCKEPQKENVEEFFSQQILYFAGIGTAMGAVQGDTGVPGLRLDFNNGLRLQVPTGDWHVRLSDYDSELVFLDEDVQATVLVSLEKYYIHWHIEVWHDGQLCFEHVFDPHGQRIYLVNCSVAIGDSLAFMPYLGAARDYYQADVYYYMPEHMQALARAFYPDMPQQEHILPDTYATFYFGAGIDAPMFMPFEGRLVRMDRIGQLILGLPQPAVLPPWPARARAVQEPYVCIGVQASSLTKCWLYPHGWEQVTAALKEAGYRVLCIDKERRTAAGPFVAECPAGAENLTGDRPLIERAELLAHAAFFIGLPSGLSWLARSVGCPVIMVGGFSYPWHEFPGAYRVYNRLACFGCINDIRQNAYRESCPRWPQDSPHFLECGRSITPPMVIAAVNRLLADQQRGGIVQ